MKAAPVQCIDCIHFQPRKDAALARLGYGGCALDGRTGRYESAIFERHCESFSAAPEEVSQARRQWLTNEEEKFNRAIEKVMHDKP